MAHRFTFLWLATLVAAGCSGAPADEVPLEQSPWTFRAPHGFVNLRTMERRTPGDFYAYGVALHEAGQHGDAAMVFALIAAQAPDGALQARASFMRPATLMAAGAYLEAYRAFDLHLARFPEGDFSARAKQGMFDCAFGLARVGQTDTFLGLPILKTSTAGIELIKATLQRFPREEFSDDYTLKFARFYHERGEPDEAETQLKFILSEPTYKRSNSAPQALLLLGKIGLERYEGALYDHKPLADAKRAFEQFDIDYKGVAGDARLRAALGLEDLPVALETARKGVAFVDEKLAEREFALARFYAGRGRPESAKLYLEAILKSYPKTSYAPRARTLLLELAPFPP